MNKILCTSVLILFLFGCKKDFGPYFDHSIDLHVGNIYKYHFVHKLNNDILQDTCYFQEITGDTVIDKIKYYIFDSNAYYFYKDNAIYMFINDSLINYNGGQVVYDFNARVGDILYLYGMFGKLEKIVMNYVFNEIQKKYLVLHKSNGDDAFLKETYIYATKFGRLEHLIEVDYHNNQSRIIKKTLVGAKIQNKFYGDF